MTPAERYTKLATLRENSLLDNVPYDRPVAQDVFELLNHHFELLEQIVEELKIGRRLA